MSDERGMGAGRMAGESLPWGELAESYAFILFRVKHPSFHRKVEVVTGPNTEVFYHQTLIKSSCLV